MTIRVGVRIAAGEARAGDDASREIGVRGVDTRVEDRDRRVSGDRDVPVSLIPCDLRERPLLRVGGVARRSGSRQLYRGRRAFNRGVLRQRREDAIARVRGNVDDLGPDLLEVIRDDAAVPVNRIVDVGSARVRVEFDKDWDKRLRAAVIGRRRAGALSGQERHCHCEEKCAEHEERER